MDTRITAPACRHDGGEPCRAYLALEARLKLLESQALVDPLTGALGLDAIVELARNELARRERYGHPLTLVYIDLDDLAGVNERLGSEAGDRLLRGCAELVSRVARRSDRIGRIGDDEFLLVLANTPLSAGIIVAERLRGALQYLPGSGDTRLCASMGLVEARAGEPWESLLERARAAVARAKPHKPNSVEVEENPEEPVTAEAVGADFMKLHWRKAYESGVEKIDEEHRAIFARANALLSAVGGGLPRDELAPLAEALLDEVSRHFADEEEILRAAGWEGLEAHAAIHENLLGRAYGLVACFLQGRCSSSEVFEFLVFQLVAAHLLKEDRRYFPVLAAPPH